MSSRNLRAGASVAALVLLALAPFSALSLPTHNVPGGVAIAADQGRVDAGKEMNLTVILKMHDQAGFDKVVADLYDPASSTFHQWLNDKDFEKYAPTPAEFETVKNELVRQGFSVVSSDPRRFSIRVHGNAAIVEKAFQTELHNFTYNGRTFQAHIRDARLAGPAGDLIETVSGIERHQSRPQLSYVTNPRTGKQLFKMPLSTKESLTTFKNSLTDAPLSKSANLSWTGSPAASYSGYEYGANGLTGGFTPTQLDAHYGLTSLIGQGYNGAGQTIALVEGYGYPTAEADANAAATLFGIPKFTSSTFEVIYPEGPPLNPNAGVLSGWDVEIALDIQSAHAIAPGAKILVVASSGQDNEDQLNSLSYIVSPPSADKPLAYTVSNSWENDDEILAGALEEAAFTSVLKAGAAKGVAFQFSSGDGGDLGLGTPIGAVGVPANNPWVTAVGGTSVLNNPYNTDGGQIVTGWGNNLVFLYEFGVEDPRDGYYFGGAGGGQSKYFDKPSWQSALPGSWRQVPDVSAVADPYTGFALVVSEGGTQYGEVVGGTSLASPVFTATWAIADQWKGSPLGQAAPVVSKLTAGHIKDVTAPASTIDQYDVKGSITDSKGVHTANAAQIYTQAVDEDDPPSDLSLYSQTTFLSATWPVPGEDNQLFIALSFGTDSSLTVADGWDNVTGWGEPNGLPFIEGVTGKTTGAPLDKK